MDIIIIAITIAFFGLVGAAAFYFYKEKPQEENTINDIKDGLQKKISAYEEKTKGLQVSLENAQLEITELKKREALLHQKEETLLKEKSTISLQMGQYEKQAKDHIDLQRELSGKEEMLEKEISARREQASMLTRCQQDIETLRKKTSETEDALRKSQAALETTIKELNLCKKTQEEQKKTIQELSANKEGGAWVSKAEFDRVEKELTEKEALIQKLLNVKPQEGNDAKDNQ